MFAKSPKVSALSAHDCSCGLFIKFAGPVQHTRAPSFGRVVLTSTLCLYNPSILRQEVH
jgi:hypothetical protein